MRTPFCSALFRSLFLRPSASTREFQIEAEQRGEMHRITQKIMEKQYQ